jgi:hypothetical protein
MRKHTKLTATAGALALLAGGAIATGGLWSAEGSTSGSAHHGWPVAASRTPAADLHAARAATKRGVLTVLEVDNPKHDTFVDVGASGESPGDYFLFENKLMTPDGSRQVGRDSGRCTLGIGTFSCDATAKIFGKGKIVVSGALFSENDNRIAITGGTGAYRTAHGQLVIDDLGNGNTVLAFHVIR